uniref:Lipoprotein n=1 Tax=Candidatus Kentrum sp. TC TaxID=2126339 RepID=A0A450YI60_9GAMM|nr:MAG: hypothetical protein BECKTC1821E_GA0114239_101020 [Candidatus Kentron sp. TC]
MKLYRSCTFILKIFIVSLSFIAVGSTCEVTTQDPKKPKVEVTLYFVPEKLACRPDGYANGLARGSRCKEWKIDKFLAEAKKMDLEPLLSKIPPSQIKLDWLFSRISNYSKSCSKEDKNEYCLDADDRSSIVMIFHVHMNPEGSKISLFRLRSDKSNIPGEQTMQPYILQAGGRWLTHQRADVFLPSKYFNWCLKINNWNWSLDSKR